MGMRRVTVPADKRGLDDAQLAEGRKRGLIWSVPWGAWAVPDPVPKPLGAWLRRIGWIAGEVEELEGNVSAIAAGKPIARAYRPEDRAVLAGGPAFDSPGAERHSPVDHPDLAGVPWTGREERIGGYRVLPKAWVRTQLPALLRRLGREKSLEERQEWPETLLMRYIVEQDGPAERRVIVWHSCVSALAALKARGAPVPEWWSDWLLEQRIAAELEDARVGEERQA